LQKFVENLEDQDCQAEMKVISDCLFLVCDFYFNFAPGEKCVKCITLVTFSL